MPYSIHNSSAIFSGENCSIMNNIVSLKRKSLSLLSSEPSTKRVTLNSPPPSTTTAATEDGTSISPITSPSPVFSPLSKRVSEKSPFSTTAAAAAISAKTEDGTPISPITSPSPSFSPFSKRVSEKSPFSTTTNADAIAANTTVVQRLPFSRFTKTKPNNNKILRRNLSEPPVFNSFSDFCRYMNSQSPENGKNNSISVKLPLRRSISDPSAADIILPPAPAPATPALASETTKRKILKEFLNQAVDKEEENSAPDNNNNEENNSNNSEIS